MTEVVMDQGSQRQPEIIIPYPGPCETDCQDIIVYLRPETNGIAVESVLLKVLRQSAFLNRIKLIYLANLPGDFIVSHRIVEHHYATRLHFAAHGRNAFTPAMAQQFSRFFGIPFEKARILGSFEALKELKLSADELFHLWVPVYDILEMNGQLIKRTPQDIFIVNYDIPAILHKNNVHTDIAVMVFRTNFSYAEFRPVLDAMKTSLAEAGILDPHQPEQRVFHFSKGPFEQILDGTGYLYQTAETPVPPEDLPFFRYLLNSGFSQAQILDLLHQPIRFFKGPGDTKSEGNLFTLTLYHTYAEALAKAQSILY